LGGEGDVRKSFAGLGAVVLAGCDQDPTWVQFNADEDGIDVEVTADATLGPGAGVDLHSSTGTVLVGSVWVEPTSGPVGTAHELVLTVDSAWEDRVQRAEVEVASERGTHVFGFEQDSAELGRWVLSVTSLGNPGEERVDTLTFLLWEMTDPGDLTLGEVIDTLTGAGE
jgi:hypothetical protein